MGKVILQAVGIEVRESSCPPFSCEVVQGEIHGLLFPATVSRGPLLRVLAGLEPPRAGSVFMPSGPVRVAVSSMTVRAPAFDSPTGVLLIDDSAIAANDDCTRDSWARIAAEREQGAAIVVATSREEQAYRSDRVSLAMWDEIQIRNAFEHLGRHMSSLVNEFLRLLEEGQCSAYAAIAIRLKRLNHAARDLVVEGRKRSSSWNQMRAASGQLAGHQLDDRVLDAAIRQANDDD